MSQNDEQDARQQLTGGPEKNLSESVRSDGESCPQVSIVIPVYNEEDILAQSVRDLVQGCDAHDISYELVLCENGSKDRTVEIAEQLCEDFQTVHLLRYPEPDYGGALNAGIQISRGENIICFEIDFFLWCAFSNSLS